MPGIIEGYMMGKLVKCKHCNKEIRILNDGTWTHGNGDVGCKDFIYRRAEPHDGLGYIDNEFVSYMQVGAGGIQLWCKVCKSVQWIPGSGDWRERPCGCGVDKNELMEETKVIIKDRKEYGFDFMEELMEM